MRTKWKLALAAAIVLGAIGYMAYVGASASWQYYLTVDECLARSGELGRQNIRVSGSVAAGTLRIDPGRRVARFELAGSAGGLRAECRAPLPDNLAEKTAVVVEGRLDASGMLHGDKLLTRCPSKYQGQSGADSTQTAERPAGTRR